MGKRLQEAWLAIQGTLCRGSMPERERTSKNESFAATYALLAINGARLTADAQETLAFVAALHEANEFCFDKLVPWLRSHVAQKPPAK
jgi:hypothetical protein